MRLRGGSPSDLWQRFGFFNQHVLSRFRALQQGSRDTGGRVIWIHAVSVGEVGIAHKLVRELLRQDPGLRFVMTSTTPTGRGLAASLGQFGGKMLVIYSPVDGWFTVRRFLDVIRPQRLVLVEAEVWPNLVFAATARGIPVTLVNARLSARSEKRFRSLRLFARPIFSMLDRICVQEPEDTARFAITFGVPPQKLVCTGSIKFDMAGEAEPTDQIAQFRELLQQLPWSADDPVLLAASTHLNEELHIARIFNKLKAAFPRLRLILVPRHVERTDQIMLQLTQEALPFIRRSEPDLTSHSSRITPGILLVDTTGELRAWQHLATIVVIGKSFLASGGQNPAEAVMAGKPVVFGPHMENFEALVRLLLAKGGAIRVKDMAELESALLGLLKDAVNARRMAGAGREALHAHEGSTRMTASQLLQ
jgi:3-deoxy-D-manno-octulosonic-acid transferase